LNYAFNWKAEAIWFAVLFVGSMVADYLSSSDADILADPKTWVLGVALAALRVAIAGISRPLFNLIKSRS